MKPGVVVALILVILLPAGIFVASAVRMQEDSRTLLTQRLTELRQQSLRSVERELDAWLLAQAGRLDQSLEQVAMESSALRKLVRSTPQVRQVFRMGAQGEQLFPPQVAPRTLQEEAFLERTRTLWRDRGILHPPAAEGRKPDRGWYAWYWGDEMNLIRWVRRTDGTVLGAELEPARFAADLLAALDTPAPPDALLRLRSGRGTIIYQWGNLPADDVAPAVVLPLQAPLAAWRLEYLDSRLAAEEPASLWLVGLVALCCMVMLGLAGYLYRAHQREIQIAEQRVSFVNQVSHELKTPLTNIRMYSELLQRELPAEEQRSRNYLAVISEEAQRLSRLIANVLSFARSERQKLEITPRPADIGAVIDGVLSSFQPAFDQHGISVIWQRPPPEQALIDVDGVGQILINLIGNVEKYASDTSALEILLRRENDQLEIQVVDQGAGIPAGQEERVFEPFYRVDNRLSGAAAGTGIGLSVARELARLHGGDLFLAPAERGCRFVLTLHAPLSGATT